MTSQVIQIPYKPRPWQRQVHRSLKKFNCIVVHRRAGKTEMAVNELIKRALLTPKGSFAYIAPTYAQAKDIAWERLKFYSQYIPGLEKSEGELWIRFPNGSKIRIYGAHKPDSLRGKAFDGVVLDETQDIQKMIWEEVLLPTFFGRENWFVIFLGTPKGRNFFYDTFHNEKDPAVADKWFRTLQTVEDTGFIDTEDYRTIAAEQSYEKNRQEWFCDFHSAVSGTYYHRYIQEAKADNRICAVAYDPRYPVDTHWDIGTNDATAIWFTQDIAGTPHFIDYIEGSDTSLEKWIQIVNSKPYAYRTHYGPHDIKTRDYGTGLQRIETARRLGFHFEVTPKLEVNDGIEAARVLIMRSRFDATNCDKGIIALEAYQSVVNKQTGLVSDTPLHDWTSHAADAFRYAAVNILRRPREIQLNRFVGGV